MKIEKSGKKSAPPRRQPGQGGQQGNETLRMNNTPSHRANQEIHFSQPASVQRARLVTDRPNGAGDDRVNGARRTW